MNPTTLVDPKEQILEVLPRLYNLAHYNFKDPKDAEDATQEAVLKILAHWNTFRGEAPREHWMLKIAFTTIRSYQRSRSSRERTMTGFKDEFLERTGESSSTTLIREEDRERLRGAVQALPEELRESVILSYFQKLTQTQIASVLECTQKTVSVRLEKALVILRTQMAMGVVPLGQLMDASSLAPLPTSLKTKIITAMAAAPVGVGAVATGTLIKGALLMNTKWIIGIAIGTTVGVAAGYEGAQQLGTIPAMTERVNSLTMETSRKDAALADARKSLLKAQSELYKAMEDRRQFELQAVAAEGEKARLSKVLSEIQESIKNIRPAVAPPLPKTNDVQAKTQALLADTFAILKKVEEGGPDAMQQGMMLVTALGKITPEEYQNLSALDAESTDPETQAQVAKIMVFAAAMAANPSSEAINGTVDRLLGRLEKGEGYSEEFREGALHYMTWSNPVCNAYSSLLKHTKPEVAQRLVAYAVDSVQNGTTQGRRSGGLQLLMQSKAPEAAPALIRLVRDGAWNDPKALRAAYKGLGGRSDAGVLEFLRNQSSVTTDADLKAFIDEQIKRTESALAAAKK